MLGNLIPTFQSPGEGQSEGAWSLTGYLILQGTQGGVRSTHPKTGGPFLPHNLLVFRPKSWGPP